MTVENPLSSSDALITLAERTALIDRTVIDAAQDLLTPGMALLAVGGYGRRQLFPHSDVDLLLLFESEKLSLARKDAISAFLQRLWDSHMRVSHSVRTPDECAEVHDRNAELNISLLDQRYLTGDRSLYASLAGRLPRFYQSNRPALLRNLAQLTRERHAKYANTFYHLEPNVKDTPGGLRDFQLVCWLEQLREAENGRLGAPEVGPELTDAFRALARLRYWLHNHSGRDNNVLAFDAQDAIAEEWRLAGAAEGMREYYRHARAISRAALRGLDAIETQGSSLLSQFRDWRSRLSNAEFGIHRDRVHFRQPQHIAADPALVLRLFEFVARHGILVSGEAEQQIEARLPKLREQFADPQPLWPAIRGILALPHAVQAVRAMHDTGVLNALLPEMQGIECLVIRDFYHRYTVDEHTLVAMQNLRSLSGSYGELLSELRNPAALLFALLLHDSGKGDAGEGHVTASARLAERAMMRVQTPAEEREAILFLIRKHLELSSALQARDVFDPQTIRDVAHQVETVERLKLLTLLTYADISAVHPEAMTPWRAQQLWQLYLMVYNELTRELDTERIETLPAGPPERVEFLQGFPTRYLRTHSDTEIDGHIALEEASRQRGVGVELRRLDSAWQVTLVTGDRPGLFASLAGTLSSFGMNILRAEAFSNRRGLVLDTFAFADPNRTLDLNPSEVDRLRATVEKVLLGKADVRELLKNRPKPVLPSRKARIPARVSFDSDASHTSTLVEIVAEDRPGLLYDLASAMSSSGVNIEVVLIDTQAHKAIDVFYVTAGGKKLDAAQQSKLGEALEKACAA